MQSTPPPSAANVGFDYIRSTNFPLFTYANAIFSYVSYCEDVKENNSMRTCVDLVVEALGNLVISQNDPNIGSEVRAIEVKLAVKHRKQKDATELIMIERHSSNVTAITITSTYDNKLLNITDSKNKVMITISDYGEIIYSCDYYKTKRSFELSIFNRSHKSYIAHLLSATAVLCPGIMDSVFARRSLVRNTQS